VDGGLAANTSPEPSEAGSARPAHMLHETWEEREEGPPHVGRYEPAGVGRPGRTVIFSFHSNFQTNLNLQQFKTQLPVLKKNQTKYGFVDNKRRNNFPY
jgi:hypothetical protein